jgi:putative ABC transport system permease protein
MSPLRVFARHPAYVVTSLATVTLAVGANLVVFSFVNALWLKRRAVDLDRVVLVGRDFDIPDGSRYSEGGLDRLRQTGAFEALSGQVVTSGMFEGMQRRVALTGHPDSFESAFVTPDYFAVLGVQVRGREFRAADEGTSESTPAIISDRLWRTILHGRPDVIGLRIPATPLPLQVVGVAAPGFQGARLGERVGVWLPHRVAAQLTGQPIDDWVHTVLPMLALGRLRPGDSIESARATLATSPRGTPDLVPLEQVFGAADLPMVRVGGGDVMAMSFVMAAFVLAGGCATLMALALVHYERRQRELVIRAALGASRSRLAVQLSLELLGVAAVGTATAVSVSAWALGALPAFSLPGGVDLGRLDLTLDWRVVLVGFSGCLFALGIAGFVPVVRFTRAAANTNLMARTATAARSSLRMRRSILVVHAAVTTVVLVAAVLFVQSVTQALALGAGFDAGRVVFATAQTRYKFMRDDGPVLAARKARDLAASLDVVEQIKNLPGVETVALGAAPLGVEREYQLAQRFTFDTDAGSHEEAVGRMSVGNNYLDALGVPLLAGRTGERNEAVVTPAFAQLVWGEESALGRRMKQGSWSVTVVGVADFAFGAIRRGSQPAVLYFGGTTVASMVNNQGELALTIRTSRPETIGRSVDRLLSGAFPEGVVRVTTGSALVDADLGRERMNAWIFSGFGFVTLVLALVSVFGLVAYVIESRWREFAVRMALGATRGSIASRALLAGLEPVAIGVVGGVAAAAAMSGTIQAYLYGLSAIEPASYVGVSVVLIGGAFIAAAIAGRRILAVSVADSLRQE